MLWVFVLINALLVSITFGATIPRNAVDGNVTSPIVRGEISQMNSTHCSVTLVNQASSDLGFLTWNSLFDTHAEHHSFTVQDVKTGQRLPPGYTRVRYLYGNEVRQQHILKLAANSNWTGVFDLTKLFEVPAAGSYRVSLTPKLSAFPPSPAAGDATPRLNDLIPVLVISAPVIMKLAKSPQKLLSRSTLTKRDSINNCDAGQEWVIRKSLESAKIMATYASAAVPLPPKTTYLWTKYFNSGAFHPVYKAFSNIAVHNIDGDSGSSWYCGQNPIDPPNMCDGGLLGYNALGKSDISLCPEFFTRTWASSACGEPGKDLPLLGGWVWEVPMDQPSLLLHEMLHNEAISKVKGIHDGPELLDGWYT